MTQTNRRRFIESAMGAAALAASSRVSAQNKRPNILWICVEDMSAHWGCYGETAVQTPHIDKLASEGARFTNAYITCPVCSPSRSAMITGMYQTTIGSHNHRSSRGQAEIRLPEWLRLLPDRFRDAGYFVTNANPKANDKNHRLEGGKTDYNFEHDGRLYDGVDWSARKPGQPFFAQLQPRGGKNRGAKVPQPVDPDDVILPPYYPDHPVVREDWAKYLNSVIWLDIEVGHFIDRLKQEGELDNTYIFLWTDHGISHARGKQFLYDEGVHIPLIVRGPGVQAGQTIEGLVEHIDISYTSLQLAELPIPNYLQGRSLFDGPMRERIASARDRCDETVERMRCIRDRRFKYIRNYYPHKTHLQPNRYKDNKEIIKAMREWHAEGKLNELQARVFAETRPLEELYDLQNDPFETRNLAGDHAHQERLDSMRSRLHDWMDETRDLGWIPEPEYNELLKRYDSAYDILLDEDNRKLVDDLRELDRIAQGGTGALDSLARHLNDERSTIRFQAAMHIADAGLAGQAVKELVKTRLTDEASTVRMAAARALARMGDSETARPVLVDEMLNAENEAVRHYAALALEEMGKAARPALNAIEQGRADPYDYVKRVCDRIAANLG